MQGFSYAFVEVHKGPFCILANFLSIQHLSSVNLSIQPDLQTQFCSAIQASNEDFKQYQLQYENPKNITCYLLSEFICNCSFKNQESNLRQKTSVKYF